MSLHFQSRALVRPGFLSRGGISAKTKRRISWRLRLSARGKMSSIQLSPDSLCPVSFRLWLFRSMPQRLCGCHSSFPLRPSVQHSFECVKTHPKHTRFCAGNTGLDTLISSENTLKTHKTHLRRPPPPEHRCVRRAGVLRRRTLSRRLVASKRREGRSFTRVNQPVPRVGHHEIITK